MSLRNICIVSFSLFVSLATAQHGSWSLPITVEEPGNLSQNNIPVSSGIPLPEGMFASNQEFALFENDQVIPLQTQTLVTNGKGFLRWILLDFQTTLTPGEKKSFTLKAQKPAAPVSPLSVKDNADAVVVDTGKIQFSIAKNKPFALFDTVSAGTRQIVNNGNASYVDGYDSKRYVADKPNSIIVEYAGPMRTTICIKGNFVGDTANKYLYIARVTAWAGRSDVHVKYSLANSNPDHYCYRKVKESAVELSLVTPVTKTTFGAAIDKVAGNNVWLHQSSRVVSAAMHNTDSLGRSPWYSQTPGASEPGGAQAGSGDKVLWTSQGKNDLLEGWLAAESNGKTVWVTDLYFVEDPPRRLAIKDNKLQLVGISEPQEGAKSPFSDRIRMLFDCSHISSQYVIDFDAPDSTQALSEKAKVARNRPVALAPLKWYSDTEQLPMGKFGTQADEIQCYDQWGWKYEEKDIPVMPAGKAANIGRWTCGDDNHFTSEQDTVDVLLTMYLRTGKRSFYNAAESWVNYFMDLQTWRTDGWEWKDGAGWWAKIGKGGPLGNRPVRAVDPLTNQRNYLLGAYAGNEPIGKAGARDIFFFANAKACHCHNWGEGLVDWYCLTGDRDTYEAVIDTVEQNVDTQRRAFEKVPGKPTSFYRDFTRASFLIHAARLIAPENEWLAENSDYVANVFFKRPNPEPRGFLIPPSKINMDAIKKGAGENGIARMQELGITCDETTGELVDAKNNARWLPLQSPHTWMFPPLGKAMDLYYRITGNEDARDWVIAYGEAVARVLYQEKHGTFNYGGFIVDFPIKGFAWDLASWMLPEGTKEIKGLSIPGFSGYQGGHYPDIAMRGYEYSGDPFLKQRALDLWCFNSHPGIFDRTLITKVGRWANLISTHDETVSFATRTFLFGAHPKSNERPPEAIKDLSVVVKDGKTVVSFTAPASAGKLTFYQVKCAAKPLVPYEVFLQKFADNQDSEVINWWMATNLSGEPGTANNPAPQAAGKRETFVVNGVPENASCFAVCSFDDSHNCSPISNIVKIDLK